MVLPQNGGTRGAQPPLSDSTVDAAYCIRPKGLIILEAAYADS